MWRRAAPNRPAPARRARGFFLIGVLFGVSFGARAHDLWVVAGQYRLDAGETTRVFINNGDAFPESLTLLGEHRVTALELYGPDGAEPISAFRVEGESLSFEVTPQTPGSHVVALSTRARRVRLKPEDFRDYLEENRLGDMTAMLEDLGESDRAAVERYTKWAKAFIDVGELGEDRAASTWSEPVGHPIEIVPGANPNAVVPGSTLPVRVLYDGEPLAGATVSGGKAGGPAREILTETDEDGRAEVIVSLPGRWFLRTIHMVRHEDDPEVRWESFWCTVTFEVREPESSTEPP